MSWGWGILRWYLESAVLIAASYAVLRAVLPFRFSQRHRLRIAQATLLAALLAPVAGLVVSTEKNSRPAAQVFVDSYRTKNPRLAIEIPSATLVTTLERESLALPFSSAIGLLWLLAVGVSISFFRKAAAWIRLRNEVQRLPSLRTLGKFHLAVSDEPIIPFSTKLARKQFVVVPETLLLDPEAFRLTVRHEIQHHRQKDFSWMLVQEAVSALYFWNPFTRLWNVLIHELQEFACDETLVRRRRVSPRAYGRCLIEAAQTAATARAASPWVAGVARASRPLLKRRIHMLVENKRRTLSGLAASALGLALLVLMSASALASRDFVREGGISEGEAKALVENASRNSQIPIVFNDAVLGWLNYYLATPKGRDYLTKSLRRMSAYEPMIRRKLEAYGMPEELLAIPLIESGYENMKPGKFVGAGLWMFIAETAKKYGLIVQGSIDERTLEERETVAAMDYYTWLRDHFKNDWALAMAGYNQGEDHVDRQIKESGIHDAWQLASLGRLNEYLYQAMAAIIILKNPSVYP